MNLPNSVGSFEDLFYQMETEIQQQFIKKTDYGQAINMTPNEKKISFLIRLSLEGTTEVLYKTELS